MKLKYSMLLSAATLSASAVLAIAQDNNPPAGGPGGPGGPGAGGPGGRRGPSPLIQALDKNADGTIDADEIAKATESLKSLDKNGDGKLTAEEIRPARGQGGPGGPGGPGGQGGAPGGPTGPAGRGPGPGQQ